LRSVTLFLLVRQPKGPASRLLVADRWPNVQSACSGGVHERAGRVRVGAPALLYPYKSLSGDFTCDRIRACRQGGSRRSRLALTLGVAPSATTDGAVKVSLEIDGKNLFGTVSVTTFDDTLCDVGNNSATPITALIDASDKFEFNVQPQFDDAIKDFVVTAIDVDEAGSTRQWNIYVNNALVTNSGCHAAIQGGDRVTCALKAANQPPSDRTPRASSVGGEDSPCV